MAGEHNDESPDRLTPLLGALTRLGSAVGSMVAGGTAQLVALQRHEARRIAAILALSLAAALFACGAAGFAAYSVLVALGEEHRVAAAALIAGCFALLSGISVLLARSRPGPP
jgi:uncharacterized membrane protein YqjE